MADKQDAGYAAPAESNAVDGDGNLTVEQIAGRLLSESQEAVGTSDEGEADSAEQATNEFAETGADGDAEVSDATEDPADDSNSHDGEAEDEDDVLSESDDLSDAGRKKLVKRVNKLTKRAKDAEEELQRRDEQLQSLQERLEKIERGEEKPDERPATFTDRVQQASTLEQLEQMQKTARETIKWARRHMDEPEVEVNGTTLERDDVLRMLEEAEDVLQDTIPKRANYLMQRQQVEQNTLKEFPAWGDREHPDYKLLHQVWNDPTAKSMFHTQPNGRYLASVFVEGLKVLEGKQAKPAGTDKPKEQQAQPRKQQAVAPRVPGVDEGVAPSMSSQSLSDVEKRIQAKDSLSFDDLVAIETARNKARATKKG